MGVMLVFLSIGGLLTHALSGQTKAQFKGRRLVAILGGTGLLLLLVAGFGMIAKTHAPWTLFNWLGIKTLVWVFFGMFPMFAYRDRNRIRLWVGLTIVLGVAAAYLAIFKPF
jgi:uncharacterized membrane protein SirB2